MPLIYVKLFNRLYSQNYFFFFGGVNSRVSTATKEIRGSKLDCSQEGKSLVFCVR